ncbi:hypothetical protein Lcho_2263 [Leptothrix cholodnii SP-6]|uniref:Uncharacterized protein n=1 Tax=Leptothrix cholodnii (strain ATCC 51168 / LMG 8142 / SP-6) TaxID=395495 RepID=B1Y3K1_LEPCP|nr:hypothetical protein [Leptothrix cholodnii]ACB34529.1 hypothetical protein Lcho_2263 [Leptothrix cholodnii SP-6]
MSNHSTAAGDTFDVQLRMLMRLIVHLDERGAVNAQEFLADLANAAGQLPPGPQVAQRLVVDATLDQLNASRQLRLVPSAGQH